MYASQRCENLEGKNKLAQVYKNLAIGIVFYWVLFTEIKYNNKTVEVPDTNLGKGEYSYTPIVTVEIKT